jgi:hypothetical protein
MMILIFQNTICYIDKIDSFHLSCYAFEELESYHEPYKKIIGKIKDITFEIMDNYPCYPEFYYELANYRCYGKYVLEFY